MLLTFIFTLFLLTPSTDSGWDLKKDKSGIAIYTRTVQGSSFNEFKGVTTITNSSLNAVLDVILDVKNYASLFPDCLNPRILKQEGKWYDIHYIQTEGPFPVKDRDSVFEQKTVVDKEGKHAVVTLMPLPDYIAENKDMVRVRQGSGYWELDEGQNGDVRVIYQFHGDPGGEIPSWLANTFVVSHPFKVLTNLTIRVKK
jgi:hypothetical protein